MDQQALVERARGGDHDAFAVLVRASAARLDAAARLILRDRELARDAVQDAYIRAWRNLPGLRDPDRNGEAWLLPVSGAQGQRLPWADSTEDLAWRRLAP